MRLPIRQVVAIGVALVLPLVSPETAAAAPTPAPASDVSTYVSDRFKLVAQKTFAQLSAETISRACPSDRPLCAPVVEHLGSAVGAAITGDGVALRGALNEFFIESSVVAGLQPLTSELIPAGASKEWAATVGPLLRCVSHRLAGRASRTSCGMGAADRSQLETSKVLAEGNGFSAADRASIGLLRKALAEHRTIEPALALRVLAAIATSKQVDRPDLRVFLLALEDWVKQGLTDGLFAPTFEFLARANATIRAQTLVNDVLAYGSGAAPAQDFWDPSLDAYWRKAIAACHANAGPFETWVSSRDSYLADTRRRLLLAWPVDVTVLLDLEGLSCASDSADAKVVGALRKHVRYLRAALQVHDWTTRQAAAALSAAALIDYVRTRDDKELTRNLRAIVLVGAARVALHARNLRAFPQPGQPIDTGDVADVLRTCEFQSLAAALGAPVSRGADPTTCKELGSGTVKGAPSVAAVSEAGIRTALDSLAERLKAEAPAGSDVAVEANADVLLRAARHLAAGDLAAAVRGLLRLGIDLLIVRVDAMTTSFLDVSEKTCTSDAESRSIFKGMDAGCAAQLLIQSAYHPIADYFWEKGTTSQDSAEVSASVYRSLLANPYLDTTPIILNVGLGGNYIVGPSDAWTDHGYGTMTLMEKVGVAFYKHSGKRFRFETGPFIGGFLDALVRTAADDGTAQRYWLAGYTAGWPRMWGIDMGLEIHAAAAMPFSLNSTNHYGFATGAALVVPFNFLFEGGK